MNNNSEILNLLKTRYKDLTGKSCRSIKLPSYIDFILKGKTITMFVNKPTENMQTNDAAFEAWALAIKTWLSEDVDSIVLDYNQPDELVQSILLNRFVDEEVNRRSYNRFLFRIHGLLDLFPDWFSVVDSKRDEATEFMRWLSSETRYLNRPMQASATKTSKEDCERQKGIWFINEARSKTGEYFDVLSDTLFDQLPVGVFVSGVKNATRIFTGGASAIDFWGIGVDRTTFHLFELKSKSNKGLGVISEVLFYTQLMKCALVDQPKWLVFSDKVKGNESRGIDILEKHNITKISAHIVAEDFHCLFDHDYITNLNNRMIQWNSSIDQTKYNYANREIYR
ncbi:MAG: hypothetical protein SCM11_04395 [Bacillota bacterium]|nr:hypothetical protein [Bacillota bacterium]